jgi:hypothetical protein
MVVATRVVAATSAEEPGTSVLFASSHLAVRCGTIVWLPHHLNWDSRGGQVTEPSQAALPRNWRNYFT